MTRLASSLLLLLIAALSLAADFSGKYEAVLDGEKYVMTLKQTGVTLSGDVAVEGVTFKVAGAVDGDKVTGTMTLTGTDVKLAFRGGKSEKGLDLKVAGQEDDGSVDWAEADDFKFVLIEGAKPEPKKENVLSKFAKQPSAVLKEGREFVHASGGKFRYPADWMLTETATAIQLIPKDANADDEAYFIVADSAEGHTDPGSKAAVDAVDAQVREIVPFVKRIGNVEKAVAGNGPGAIVTWSGNARTGKEIYVRAYMTILKNYGVALVAFGTKATLDKRDKTLREIFATFGWGQGKLDTQLVGTWNHWSYSGTGGYGKETKAKVILDASGNFSYETDSETSISAQGTNSLGNVEWTGGMASRRGSGWKGTWTADGKNLILHFEDGSTESFTYAWKREGANTFLVVTEEGGKKPTEWSKAGS